MVTVDSRLVGEVGVYIHDMWMTPVNIIGTDHSIENISLKSQWGRSWLWKHALSHEPFLCNLSRDIANTFDAGLQLVSDLSISLNTASSAPLC